MSREKHIGGDAAERLRRQEIKSPGATTGAIKKRKLPRSLSVVKKVEARG